MLYIVPQDNNDKTLVLTQEDCDCANDFVDVQLQRIDIDPNLVDPVNTLLKNIAMWKALEGVATRSIIGENSQMEQKANLYRRMWQDALPLLTRKALGIIPVLSANVQAFPTNIPLERG